MANSIEIKATLTAFGAPPREVTATIVPRSPGERMLRAVGGVAIFWGLALGGLFIPVAHLILVPTFLAAGVIFGIRRAREDLTLATVRGACPRCGVEQEFRIGRRLAGEMNVACPSCHNYLRFATDEIGGVEPASQPHSM